MNTDLINNTDFAPTLLELAGVKSEAFPVQFQGHSFVANLEGNTPSEWRTASYYRYFMHMAHHDNPAHFGIRTAQHKLIFFYGRRLNDDWYYPKDPKHPTEPYWELYDVAADPHEMNNLYGKPGHEKWTRKLKEELFRLREQIGDTDAEYPEMAEALRLAP